MAEKDCQRVSGASETANYFIVVGVIETVALFTPAFRQFQLG